MYLTILGSKEEKAMNECNPSTNLEYYEVPSLRLRDKTTEELYESLLEVATGWAPEQQEQLQAAYSLALRAHRDDLHKENRPYSEHLLRVASRLVNYMEITDPDIIIAALLHDIVEDHAREIIDGSLMESGAPTTHSLEELNQLSAAEEKALALAMLSQWFSPRVSMIVESVTNTPRSDCPMNYEDKIRAYVDKIRREIRSFETWLVKVADFFDNGLSVNYDIEGQGDKHAHFVYKYGMALPVLMARFEEDDIQSRLSENAKQYVRQQFRVAMQRLLPEDSTTVAA